MVTNRQTRRVPINQNGTAQNGANFMGTNSVLSAATALPDVRATAINIRDITGYYPGTISPVFLQIFENTEGNPIDGTVPKLSIPINTTLNREFLADYSTALLTLKGPLSWALSSTQKTKTQVAETVNFWVDIEEYENVPDNLSAAGDFSTGVDSLQPWTEASNTTLTKRLWRVEAINTSVSTLYLLLFARNAASVTGADVPLWTGKIKLADIGLVKQFNFGSDGIKPDALVNLVEKKGCSLHWSTDPKTLVAPGAQPGTIKAYYF